MWNVFPTNNATEICHISPDLSKNDAKGCITGVMSFSIRTYLLVSILLAFYKPEVFQRNYYVLRRKVRSNGVYTF